MFRLRIPALSLCLALALSARADHDQHLDLKSGLNFVAIMVETGSNTLADLFPDAPTGMVVFKFDNARGYAVSQLYSNGWSDAAMSLKPGEAAIMLPPAGQEPHFHIEGEREYPLPAIYRGWNLIPLRSVFPLPPQTAKISPKHGDEIWAPLGMGAFSLATYDGNLQTWLNLRLPPDGAVWYRAVDWPGNPAGTADLRGVVYLNNYAPGFGVDEPLLDGNGCALDGVATLARLEPSGAWTPIGPSVPVRGGYLDPAHNLMREISGDELASHRLAIQFSSPNGVSLTEPATIVLWKGLFPVGLTGAHFAARPVFLANPESLTARQGAPAELSALFQYRGAAASGVQSLAAVESCLCPIAYQWQQRTEAGEWHDVPGATAARLRVGAVAATNYGTYRLKAAWGCRTEFSAMAAILPPPSIAVRNQAPEGLVELDIAAEGMARVQLELSSDLATWQVHAAKTHPDAVWTVRVPSTVARVFFRCRATLP